MGQKIIALDAMGGDHGPSVTVGAAKLALDEISGVWNWFWLAMKNNLGCRTREAWTMGKRQ